MSPAAAAPMTANHFALERVGRNGAIHIAFWSCQIYSGSRFQEAGGDFSGPVSEGLMIGSAEVGRPSGELSAPPVAQADAPPGMSSKLMRKALRCFWRVIGTPKTIPQESGFFDHKLSVRLLGRMSK